MKRHLKLVWMLFILLAVSVSPLAAQDEDAYPVTLEHKFGSTTLEERPERIVSLGYTEQDPLYALGAEPVAIRYWYGDENDAIFPWAEDAADTDPVVLNMPYGSLNYEAILALEPDFISAIGSGITEDEYESLSQIAPTLAQSADYVDFGSPWQVTTRTLGRALGVEDEADALVEDVEAQFETVRENNPQFQDQTVAVGYYGRGTYGYYTEQDGRGRFFTELGFVVPDELSEIAGDSFYADISEERVDLLDQDLLIFLGLQFAEDGSAAAREFIQSDPLVQQLDAVQDDRVLYIDDEYDDALQFTTVLSLEYLLDNLVPEIAAVVPPEDTATETSAEDDAASYPVTVEHSYGSTTIEEEPQRVVTLEWTYTEDVLALGVQPVGVADIEGYGNWVDIPVSLSEDAADVGTRQEPNLEQIVALEPDLIITSALRVTENYDELSAIAPTLVFNAYPAEGASHYDNMVDTFNTIADVLNRQAEAETVLADVQATYDRAAAAVDAAALSTDEFILAQTYLSGDAPVFRLFTDNAMAVEILTKLGLENAWDEAPGEYGFTTVDFETFGDIGDVNFFYIAQPDANEAITSAPVWAALPFVQSDRAYWLGGEAWLFGGPLSAVTLVDTLTDALGVDVAPADTATETTDAAATDGTCEDGFRLFDHEYLDGEPVCVPDNPQRVVALDMASLELLMYTDKDIVGSASWILDEYQAMLPEMADAVADIPDVGYPANLESVLEVDPDIILAYSAQDNIIDAEQAANIAPVVSTTLTIDDWERSMQFWAQALNVQPVFEDLQANYDARIDALQAALPMQPSETEVSLVTANTYGVSIWLADSPQGKIVQDAGFARPAPQDIAGEAAIEEYGTLRQYATISDETLNLADGDIIYLFKYATTDEEIAAEEAAAVEAFQERPLWQQLDGVQNGEVYVVGDHWYRAGTYLLANAVIDDLFTTLTDLDPADVDPTPILPDVISQAE